MVGDQEKISMFSTCSELAPCAPIPDSRIAQFMQPCLRQGIKYFGVNWFNLCLREARDGDHLVVIFCIYFINLSCYQSRQIDLQNMRPNILAGRG